MIDYIQLAKENLDMYTVINACGDTITGNYIDKCIFKEHTTKSRMKVRTNNCFCYNCWKSADVISYWSESKNISSQFEAAKDLCNFMGLIDKEHLNNMKNNNNYSIKKEDKPKKIDTIENILKYYEEESFNSDIASDDILNRVYSIFIEACKEYNKCTLLNHHYKHLSEERKMSDEMIENFNLFSFPEVKEVDYEIDCPEVQRKKHLYNAKVSDTLMQIMENKLEEIGYDISSVMCVPFFQFDTKYKKFTMNIKYNGFVIPIKSNGNIIALQQRRDNKPKSSKTNKKSSRYNFLVSKKNIQRNESEEIRYSYGASCSSPAMAIFPHEINNKKIFITEGFFKAEKIVSTLGSICIYLQSVGPWKSCIPVLAEILRKKEVLEKLNLTNNSGNIENTPISQEIEIIIAFDTDGKINELVSESAKRLAEVLKRGGFKVQYVTWDNNLGKGIDDIINNGHINSIFKYEKEVWEGKQLIITNYLERKFKKKINEITEEEKELWINEFQKLEVYTNQELKEMLLIS